jgi:plastocyanin
MSDHRRFSLLCGVILSLAPVANAAVAAGAVSSGPSGLLVRHGVLPPVILAHAGSAGDAVGDMVSDDEGSARGGWPHFVRWVGHFHPAMTVFPIGMLLGAALAELFLILSGAAWLGGACRWCVIVGAVGGAITAPLGWAFAAGPGGSRLLEIHRWLGTTSAAGAVVILLLSEARHRSTGGKWRTAFRTVLFLAVPLVMATGFFGGAMVYGLHEYDWNPPRHGGGGDGAGRSSPGPGSITRDAAVVEMTDDDVFKPRTITVVAGATVRWHNASTEEHTVTDDPHAVSDARDVSFPAGATAFNSGTIRPGGSFEKKFTVPGTYKYVCNPHEEMDMKGEIVVKPPPG